MTNRFMISVAAAALIAGTGFANAQGTGGRDAPSAGSAQQSAPSSERGGSSAAPMNRDAGETKAPSSGMKATQSDDKSPGAVKNRDATDSKAPSSGTKATQSDDKSPGAGKNQRTEENMQGQKSKGMSSESEGAKGSKDMKAEDREGSKDMKAQSREGQMTTGQAGAGAKLSTEQRTKITTVIRDQRVQPLTNVNFSIGVGSRVPRDVRFHALPQEVVTIYPEWRGYEFVLVKNQIIVVDPRTYEIVAVLDA